jgi:hypothetical protein
MILRRRESMPNSSANSGGEGRKDSSREDKEKKPGREAIDWGQATVDALNRHTSSPEFLARYKAWLECIGPDLWTPTAKRDYEAMAKESIDPELVAKYKADFGFSQP